MELLNTAFAGGRIITILGGQSNEFTGNCDGRLCMGRHRRLSLEQGALSGKYDAAHPFPEGSARAKVFNPLLPQLGALVGELKRVAAAHNVSAAQIATAYAVGKGALPILGVTKLYQEEEAVKTAEIVLSAEEMASLEAAADTSGVSSIQFWESKME